jgi:hypothetical protein
MCTHMCMCGQYIFLHITEKAMTRNGRTQTATNYISYLMERVKKCFVLKQSLYFNKSSWQCNQVLVGPRVASFWTESPSPKIFKFGFIVRFVLYSDIMIKLVSANCTYKPLRDVGT